jgi:DNA polymerase III sliding clamp (beta) subunit (PCNA family)
VLQFVHVSINGHVHFGANNLEAVHVEAVQSIAKDGEASIAVNAKQLRKLVTSSKDNEVTIEIDENNLQLKLTGAQLECEPASDYPPISFSTGEADANIWVEADKLASMLNYCVIAADDQSMRYALGGCLFEVLGGELRVIGTDGRRLHTADNCHGHRAPTAHSAIVHADHCTTLSMACKAADSVNIQICIDHVKATCYKRGEQVAMFSFRQVEGRYPNWRACFQNCDNHEHSIRVRSDLASIAFSRLATVTIENEKQWELDYKAYSKQLKTNPKAVCPVLDDTCVIAIDEDSIVAAASSCKGQKMAQTIELAYRNRSEVLKFHANAKYLEAAFSKCELTTLKIGSPVQPIIVQAEEHGVSFQAIVMPQKIGK